MNRQPPSRRSTPARRSRVPLARLTLAGLVVLSASTTAAAPSAGAVSPADLNGSWILDPALSHDQASRERSFGGPDREGGERRPEPRDDERRERSSADSDNPAGDDDQRERFRRMTIHQEGDAVSIEYGDGTVVEMTVGTPQTRHDERGGDREVEASWSEQGDLVVRTTRSREVTTETFVLTHDRKLLTVLVEARTSRGDRSSRRVYRPVEDVPGAAVLQEPAPAPQPPPTP